MTKQEIHEKELLVEHARMAEQTERYEDMVLDMKHVAELEGQLNDEERNLLSMAYKNSVGNRRTAWRILKAMEEGEQDSTEENNSDQKKEVAKQYREKVEAEMRQGCDELLGLLDTVLIPKATVDEHKTFYLKMKGDYYRYSAEIASGEEKTEVVKKSEEVYKQAFDLAKEKLAPNNPVRLGLALNYSVFYYEILLSPAEACKLAQETFDDAIAHIGDMREENRDTALVLQLLNDNLSLWKGLNEGGNLLGEELTEDHTFDEDESK